MEIGDNVKSIRSINRFATLEEDFNRVHNGKYLYTNSVYIKQSLPIDITCPVHGDFTQSPNNHLAGHGCLQCSEDSRLKYTSASFIQEATKVHGGIYQYNLIPEGNIKGKVPIVCPVHGVFYQTARNHIVLKHTCKACTDTQRGVRSRKSYSTWVTDARKVHGDKYNYDYVILNTYDTYVIIVCPIHGGFKQKASSHVSGIGCRYCNCVKDYTNYYNVPTLLYYIKLKKGDNIKYKIGITTKSIKVRYRGHNDIEISEVLSYRFNSGNQAFLAEQHILGKYKEYVTKDKKFIKNGVTEVFDKDVVDVGTFNTIVNLYKESTNDYNVLHRY